MIFHNGLNHLVGPLSLHTMPTIGFLCVWGGSFFLSQFQTQFTNPTNKLTISILKLQKAPMYVGVGHSLSRCSIPNPQTQPTNSSLPRQYVWGWAMICQQVPYPIHKPNPQTHNFHVETPKGPKCKHNNIEHVGSA